MKSSGFAFLSTLYAVAAFPFPSFLTSRDVSAFSEFRKRSIFTQRGPTTKLDAIADMVGLDDDNRRDLLGSDRPVLVDAYAPWCGPCKLIEPVLERCEAAWGGALQFCRLNMDAGERIHEIRTDMMKQGMFVRKLPALILFHRGEIKASHSGLIGDEELESFLSEHLKEEVASADNGNERGRISFASTFGKDEYFL